MSKANAIECMNRECTMIYRVDKEDLQGDLCANCGSNLIRFVHIEIVDKP